jgi:hypothetical protein
MRTARGHSTFCGFGEAQSAQKKSTPRKVGKVGKLGNVTRFPRVFRCFLLEIDFANVCQVAK